MYYMLGPLVGSKAYEDEWDSILAKYSKNTVS